MMDNNNIILVTSFAFLCVSILVIVVIASSCFICDRRRTRLSHHVSGQRTVAQNERQIVTSNSLADGLVYPNTSPRESLSFGSSPDSESAAFVPKHDENDDHHDDDHDHTATVERISQPNSSSRRPTVISLELIQSSEKHENESRLSPSHLLLNKIRDISRNKSERYQSLEDDDDETVPLRRHSEHVIAASSSPRNNNNNNNATASSPKSSSSSKDPRVVSVPNDIEIPEIPLKNALVTTTTTTTTGAGSSVTNLIQSTINIAADEFDQQQQQQQPKLDSYWRSPSSMVQWFLETEQTKKKKKKKRLEKLQRQRALTQSLSHQLNTIDFAPAVGDDDDDEVMTYDGNNHDDNVGTSSSSSNSSNVLADGTTREVQPLKSHRASIITLNELYDPVLELNEYCQMIVQEFIATERTYVRNLQLLVDIYMVPQLMLRRGAMAGPDGTGTSKTKHLLSEEAMHVIFDPIKSILDINNDFLLALEQGQKTSSSGSRRSRRSSSPTTDDTATNSPNAATTSPAAGVSVTNFIRVFLRKVDNFRHYTQYINNYQTAMLFYAEETESNKEFVRFCQDCEKQLEDMKAPQRTLPSFLILPIQRLPRYEMLIRDLKQHATASNASNKALELAFTKIKEINDYCNERKKEMEATIRVAEIQDEFKLTGLVQLWRKFLCEERVIRKVKKNEKGDTPCQLYLFSDVLLCIKDPTIAGQSVNFALIGKRRILIPLKRKETTVNLLHEKDNPLFKNAFEVCHPKYNLKLICLTPQQRDLWVQQIQKCIDSSSVIQRHHLAPSSSPLR